MDISNLAPEIAKLFGVQPSTLVLLIMIITTAANAGARLIPSDATGFLGGLRKVCSIVGVYVQNRVTSGVTVTDVAKAALDTQPITGKAKVESQK